jgi:hypothetical protein
MDPVGCQVSSQSISNKVNRAISYSKGSSKNELLNHVIQIKIIQVNIAEVEE